MKQLINHNIQVLHISDFVDKQADIATLLTSVIGWAGKETDNHWILSTSQQFQGPEFQVLNFLLHLCRLHNFQTLMIIKKAPDDSGA